MNCKNLRPITEEERNKYGYAPDKVLFVEQEEIREGELEGWTATDIFTLEDLTNYLDTSEEKNIQEKITEILRNEDLISEDTIVELWLYFTKPDLFDMMKRLILIADADPEKAKEMLNLLKEKINR